MHRTLNQEVRIDRVNPYLQEAFQACMAAKCINSKINGLKQKAFYYQFLLCSSGKGTGLSWAMLLFSVMSTEVTQT